MAKTLQVELESFLPFSDAFRIGRTQEDGQVFGRKLPPDNSSPIALCLPDMRGTIVIMNDRVMGTFQWQRTANTIESAIRGGVEGKHVLFLLG